MTRLHEQGLGIDILTVGDELDRAGHLKEYCAPGATKTFDGRAALSLLRELETSENGYTYAMRISDAANKRELERIFTESVNHARNGKSSAEIISYATKRMSALTVHGTAEKHTLPMEIATAQALSASERAFQEDRRYTTGLIDLDRIVKIHAPEIVTFAARPGKGKSAMVCGTIPLANAQRGKRVLIFSVEMSTVQLTQRLAAQLGSLNSEKLMSGELDEDEWTRYHDALDKLALLPITICDLGGIRISEIRSEARKANYDLIILDYIQLANADARNDRRDLDIGEVTGGLKALVKELDIPVIAAAQMSRAVEMRADKKPNLSDLRESGSIENDSDTVVFIHHPSELSNEAEFIVAKHRHGATGVASALFLREQVKFVNAQTFDLGKI